MAFLSEASTSIQPQYYQQPSYSGRGHFYGSYPGIRGGPRGARTPLQEAEALTIVVVELQTDRGSYVTTVSIQVTFLQNAESVFETKQTIKTLPIRYH